MNQPIVVLGDNISSMQQQLSQSYSAINIQSFNNLPSEQHLQNKNRDINDRNISVDYLDQ